MLTLGRYFEIYVMIRSQLLLFFLLQLCLTGLCNSSEDLVKIDNFGANPGKLKMFVHVDAQNGDSAFMPLVIVLHGCGQNANGVSKLTGWNKLADINKFVVLYPQQRILNNPDLCFNWFYPDDINRGMGECESIYQMISFIRRHYRVDSSRIFITGLSAGAAMSVVMMATHPEAFKCGAIFAGGAYKMATNPIAVLKGMNGNLYIPKETLVRNVLEQNPDYKGHYPGMIVYQGSSDPVVNCRNSIFLVNQWTGINKADSIPDRIDSAYMNVGDITRKQYLNSAGEQIVLLYEIKDLGHRLLIKPGDHSDEGGQTGLFGVNRNFHSTFQTAKDFHILRE